MIRASYAEMQSAAGEITKASEEYRSNVGSLYQIVDELVNNWKGTDNLSYATTVNNYKNEMKELGIVVEQYARFLSNSANVISNTQDEISADAGRLS